MNKVLSVKIKKLNENAVIPKYAKLGDGAFDLTAISKENIGNDKIRFGFGLAFEIPENHFMMIVPRT